MQFAFLNTRGWNEEKWRNIIVEGKNCDIIGLGETGWINSIEWHEGGWMGMGTGRQIGEKKGGGVGIIMKKKTGRKLEVRSPGEKQSNLGYSKGDMMTVRITEGKDEWWITVLYVGVEGRENHQENRKMYEAVVDIKEEVGDKKWIIMGDLNGHIGLNNERVNTNGRLILEFVEKAGVKIKNWELENPITWRDKRTESAIDYIIINKEMEREGCRIWKNEEIDISDHTMIGITCKKNESLRKRKKEEWREKWNTMEANWERYTEQVEGKMSENVERRRRSINEWEADIKHIMRKKAEKVIGKKKIKIGNRRPKGWWDKEVEEAIASRKRENRNQRRWKGKITKEGEQHRLEWEKAWEKYQTEKKKAKIIVSKKIGKWEAEQAEKLNNLPRGEREREGWKRLKRNLSDREMVQEIKIRIGDKVITKEEEIRVEIEKFWKNVIWKEEEVENKRESTVIFSDKKEMKKVQIEEKDVEKALKRIKNGKAGGTDEIIGELVKYSGQGGIRALTSLFNTIMEEGEVPEEWRMSKVTLIHKGGGKSKEDIGNYRPISVMNILAKVMGMVLNEKIVTWAEQEGVWGEEQNGFRRGRGGIDNLYILKEVIERSAKLGKKLYLTFLDLERAYDTVNRGKLMTLLKHIGVEERVIEVLKSMYENNRVQFTLGNISTKWIENNTGVRQGCVISPTLFNIYLEELIWRIRKADIGVRIGEKKLGCLAYADDVVLMAEKKEDMEQMLTISRKYGVEWYLRYSENKCKVMEFNSMEESQWVLGNNILEIVDKFTYLGMEVSREGIGGERQRKINEGKARRMAGMILNGGSRQINKFEVGRSLWKGVAVPYCLYGTEVTNYTEGDMMKLEKVQNIVGRWGLGAPKCTATEAIRGDMGWSTFRERIIKGKLGYAKKLETMEDERWAKILMKENEVVTSGKKEIRRWKRRENVEENWENMGYMEVKKAIEKNGRSRWEEGVKEKTSLTWYARKEKPEGIKWHDGDWGSKLLFKARTGTLEVKGRNRDITDRECKFCIGERETIEHIIVECKKYDEERKVLIEKVEGIIGKEEWQKRKGNAYGGICTVLGLWKEGGEEAKKIIKHTKIFLAKCWEKRQTEPVLLCEH